MDEISIKFGMGLAEPFTGKDGKEFMRTSTARACGLRSLQKEPQS